MLTQNDSDGQDSNGLVFRRALIVILVRCCLNALCMPGFRMYKLLTLFVVYNFLPCFIHQVIIITGLNKLQLYVLALKMALDADRA